jgi:hypothetical protein
MSQQGGGPSVEDREAASAAGSGGGRSGRAAGPSGPGESPNRRGRSGLGGEGQPGKGGQGTGAEAQDGQEGSVPEQAQPDALAPPPRSPLYLAEHAQRFQRQQLIRDYQAAHGCRLIVMIDPIFAYGVQYFEELVFNASPDQPLHLLLWSPGGDGEVAVRLVRSAQARCSELTVIVPDIAKSAATLLALGADGILMGPASDLGPVDPQFPVGEYDLVSAKDMIEAVDRALADVAERPDTFPLHSSLLAEVNALRVQQARSALERTDDLVREALRSNPRRGEQEVEELAKRLHEPLIEAPKDHAAIFSAEDARKHGLPVISCDPSSDQWRRIWQLWMHYYTLFPVQVYKGDMASQVRRRSADSG